MRASRVGELTNQASKQIINKHKQVVLLPPASAQLTPQCRVIAQQFLVVGNWLVSNRSPGLEILVSTSSEVKYEHDWGVVVLSVVQLSYSTTNVQETSLRVVQLLLGRAKMYSKCPERTKSKIKTGTFHS